MTSVGGHVWTPQGWTVGRLDFTDRIQSLRPDAQAQGAGHYLIPGLIDVHVHGGGGADVMDGPAGVRALAQFHARHGTTSLLATTITAPWPQVLATLDTVSRVRQSPRTGEASVLGAHLEGPFISPERLGAQPKYPLLPEPERVAAVLETGVLRVVTLAPELPGALVAAGRFAAAGVRVSLGHTAASAEQAQRVIATVLDAGGVVGGTHVFNAMTGLGGRDPGVVGALLAEPRTHAEVILDGHHVHSSSFLSVLNAKPERTLLITDAMRAAGMPGGQYDLGGQLVTVQDGQARLPGGGLAGSLLTMDAALRQAVAAGVPLHQAAALGSAHPARYLGLTDRGTLAPGEWADLVVLDPDLMVQQVYLRGAPLR